MRLVSVKPDFVRPTQTVRHHSCAIGIEDGNASIGLHPHRVVWRPSARTDSDPDSVSAVAKYVIGTPQGLPLERVQYEFVPSVEEQAIYVAIDGVVRNQRALALERHRCRRSCRQVTDRPLTAIRIDAGDVAAVR